MVWLSYGTETTLKLTQRLIKNIQWLRAYKLQNIVLNSGLRLGATLPSCHTTAYPVALLTLYTAHISKRDMIRWNSQILCVFSS